MKKEITWKTQSGKTATVTVELINEKTVVNADGYIIETSSREIAINVTAKVEGMGNVGLYLCTSGKFRDGFVACIGKLALSQENYDRVAAAIAECEATPAWKAHQAKLREQEEVSRKYNEHCANMREIMGE